MLAGLFSYLPTLMHHLVQHEGRARSVESIPQVLSRDRVRTNDEIGLRESSQAVAQCGQTDTGCSVKKLNASGRCLTCAHHAGDNGHRLPES